MIIYYLSTSVLVTENKGVDSPAWDTGMRTQPLLNVETNDQWAYRELWGTEVVVCILAMGWFSNWA